MMGNWSGWGWGMGFGWIFMIFFWALIVLGVVALAKWLFSAGGTVGSGGFSKTPPEILKERYARGEINREQYERMRRDLESAWCSRRAFRLPRRQAGGRLPKANSSPSAAARSSPAMPCQRPSIDASAV